MENRKKILFTAPYFPPYGGGLERYVYEMTKLLSDDYDVVVVTSGERFGEDTLEHVGNVKVHRLAYRVKLSNTPISLKWYKKIKKIIATEKPDLLNVNMPVPGMGDVAILASGALPKVITYHSGTMAKKGLIANLCVYLYENTLLKYLLRKTDKIICSSDYIRYGFLNKYLGKSITITPGVDADKFKADLSKKTEYPSIIFVAGLGRGEQYKGLSTLIKSILEIRKVIPEIVLNVVGDGDMREDYEVKVEQLHLQDNIKFWGKLNSQKLAEKYQKNHMLVSASTNESFSMVILEAMSSSLPVIAFDVGSTAQMIENGKNGFLLSCTKKNDMTNKIMELIHNKELAYTFGKLGREKVEDKFTWKVKLNEYREVINDVLKNKSNV
jgi:glycosyltransferase involved in cell wall biosynthesis